jgi:hypothetical protein
MLDPFLVFKNTFLHPIFIYVSIKAEYFIRRLNIRIYATIGKFLFLE